jgi:hypothetical protein
MCLARLCPATAFLNQPLASFLYISPSKGAVAALPAEYAIIPDEIVNKLPQQSDYGLKDIEVTPVDIARDLTNVIPADFNPRPRTNPTQQQDTTRGAPHGAHP